MGSFCSSLDRKMAVVMVTPREESPVQTVTGDSLQPIKASRLQRPIRSRCSFARRVRGPVSHCAVKSPKTW
ncbi:hypothetical protein INR49_004546 [Caranx melampygus]|nr:hypothetical protein INR49_004546 [Caranx melampygus]